MQAIINGMERRMAPDAANRDLRKALLSLPNQTKRDIEDNFVKHFKMRDRLVFRSRIQRTRFTEAEENYLWGLLEPYYARPGSQKKGTQTELFAK